MSRTANSIDLWSRSADEPFGVHQPRASDEERLGDDLLMLIVMDQTANSVFRRKR